MKLSNTYPAVALLILKAIAHPAAFPASTHLSVSQDPSPPRPFPKYELEGTDPLSRFPTDPEHAAADPLVVMNDPSPPRPFPMYQLVKGNPLEQRIPLALSRFPTDGEDEANDPSPPRPFPAGPIFETKGPSPPLEQRKESKAPRKIEVDYIFEDGNPVEKRDPLSRFPTDDEKEANDPSPPRPFPPGRISEANDSSPSHIIEARFPSPLRRIAKGSEVEAFRHHDPSFGELKSRAEDFHLPPNHAHGGFFPPYNPPVSEPTASATDVESLSAGLDKRRCPEHVHCGNHPVAHFHRHKLTTIWFPRHTTANPNTTASETQAANPLGIHIIQPPRIPLMPLPSLEAEPPHRPHRHMSIATAFAPCPTSTPTCSAIFTTSRYNTTSFSNYNTTTYYNHTTYSNHTATFFSNTTTTTTFLDFATTTLKTHTPSA